MNVEDRGKGSYDVFAMRERFRMIVQKHDTDSSLLFDTLEEQFKLHLGQANEELERGKDADPARVRSFLVQAGASLAQLEYIARIHEWHEGDRGGYKAEIHFDPDKLLF